MNLLEPIKFDEGEVSIFLRDNLCALCLGHLVARPAESRQFIVECLEHGPIMSHNAVSKHIAKTVKSDRFAGTLEMRKVGKPRPADEIIKELYGGN